MDVESNGLVADEELIKHGWEEDVWVCTITTTIIRNSS
jgi:hypothetical protein